MKKITVIIADDHQLFIDGLVSLFDREEEFSILDIANDGKELLDLLESKAPDLILLDINMPKMNGLEVLKCIRKKSTKIKVIILSTYFEDHLINKAKSLGANGYMLKTVSKEALLQCIKQVIIGKDNFEDKLSVNKPVLKEIDSFAKQFNLTAREREVLSIIGTGKTNQEIANQLYLSLYTIETHRKNIMQKLGLKSPSSLMRFIVEKGI